MRRLRILFYCSCWMLWSAVLLASPMEVELSYFSKASHLANAGKYHQAAEQWHRLTIVILSSEAKLGRKRMWQYAGLSEALAAIAADKANDAVAYQYWADSTRYLMTGGTTWERVRKSLHRRYEHASTLLSTQLQVADLASGMDSQWEQDYVVLQTWEQKLGVFHFQSPKLGLSDHTQADRVMSQSVPSVPAYQPAAVSIQGKKKLSGMSNAFSHEQQFAPTNVEADSFSAKQTEVAPLSEQKSTKDIELNKVSRQLSTGESSIIVETAPVMSKGFIVTPEKATRSHAAGLIDNNSPSSAAKHDDQAQAQAQAQEQAQESTDVAPTTVQLVVEPLEFNEQPAGEVKSSFKSEKVEQIKSPAPQLIPKANVSANDPPPVESNQRRSFYPVQ